MAILSTVKLSTGFRLITGQHINNIVDAINAILGGTSGFIQRSVATGLTAAGTNQATALGLTKALNVISTAAASTGVSLPTASSVGIGGEVLIYNDGANAIKVYGNSGVLDTIDGTAGATGVTLTNALRCRFVVVAANTWKSDKLGATST